MFTVVVSQNIVERVVVIIIDMVHKVVVVVTIVVEGIYDRIRDGRLKEIKL